MERDACVGEVVTEPTWCEGEARHLRALADGDPLGIVIYRPTTPPRHRFADVDTGEVFAAADRSRYHQSAAYRARREAIFTRRCGCDRCGDLPAVLWAADRDAIGCEDDDNTVVLCRPCNNQAFRARESLGLVA